MQVITCGSGREHVHRLIVKRVRDHNTFLPLRIHLLYLHRCQRLAATLDCTLHSFSLPAMSDSSQPFSSSPSSSSSGIAFLTHSQTTIASGLPYVIDDKPLARQKRRRTRYIFFPFQLFIPFPTILWCSFVRDAFDVA